MKYAKVAALAAGTLMAMGAAAPAFADSGAKGGTANSPGLVSGDTIQAPIHLPVNLCGNSVSVVGLVNPAFGGFCAHN